MVKGSTVIDRVQLDASLQSLAHTLQSLRESRGLTLEQVSTATGVSVGRLSQLERGLGNPTFETLLKLANGLAVPLPVFFEGSGPEHSLVVRRHERRQLRVSDEDRVYELLTPDLNRALEMLWIVMRPKVWSESEPYPHRGEECGLVLSGRVEAHIGDQVILLEAGDSISLKSDVPHRYYNPGPDDLVGVWAYTPPSY